MIIKIKKILVVLVISVISIVFYSCGSSEEKGANDDVVIISPQEAGDTAQDKEEDCECNDSDSGSASDLDKRSSSNSEDDTTTKVSSSSKEVSEGFPRDVLPLLEDAEIMQATGFKNKGGTVIYTVKQPLEDVYKFYKTKLEKLDKFTETEEDGARFFYAIAEEFRIVVSITPIGENSVQVLLNAKPESK